MSYLTSTTHYITVNGQQIAYRELGKGKSAFPLVMLTHLAATLDEWDPKLLDLLAEKEHILVFDLPGVGGSQGKVATTITKMAEQARAIIRALGFEKINLLGLSMGGMIAQELVRLDSRLVNRLVLVGTGPRGGLEIDKVTGKTFRYMLKAGLERIDPKRYIFYPHDENGRLQAEQVLERMQARTTVYKDQPMSLLGFIRQLKAIKRWGRAKADELSHITQPTLIVNGDKDMQVPTANSYLMHDKLHNSQLIIYKNAGHGSIFQNAEAFSETLLTFLKESS